MGAGHEVPSIEELHQVICRKDTVDLALVGAEITGKTDEFIVFGVLDLQKVQDGLSKSERVAGEQCGVQGVCLLVV